MKTEFAPIVHDSTNPHCVTNATEVIPEVGFTALDDCEVITNPDNHHSIPLKPGRKHVQFVQVSTITGELRRIRD